LLLAAFTVRLFLFQFQGHIMDLNLFITWLQAAASHGFATFYNITNCDYPPLNVYLFWLFGNAANGLSLFGTSMITYVVKLIPTLFDLATVCLIFVFVRSRSNIMVSLLAAAAYAFNPAIIFNSSVWGQFDSIYTFFLLLSFILVLSGRLKLSVSTFTLAVLTKPQAVALVPLMALLVYKKFGLRRMLASTMIIAAITLLVILPFQWGNPITSLINIYLLGFGKYPYTSVNAYNFWALFGMWRPDSQGILFLTPYLIGWLMFVILTFLALDLVDERLKPSGETLVFFTAFILLFGFFMLPTRIHERYIFPSLSFLALMSPYVKRMRVIYGVLTVTLLINLAYALMTLNSGILITWTDPVVLGVSLVNTVVFVYILVLMWWEYSTKLPQQSEGVPINHLTYVGTCVGELVYHVDQIALLWIIS
jgi:Gpi18-like mannosyltransferase